MPLTWDQIIAAEVEGDFRFRKSDKPEYNILYNTASVYYSQSLPSRRKRKVNKIIIFVEGGGKNVTDSIRR